MKRSILGLSLVVPLFLLPAIGFSQSPASPYFESDILTPLVNYAVHGGHIRVDHPVSQPYRSHELLRAVAEADSGAPDYLRDWYRRLVREVYTTYRPDNDPEHGRWHLGARARMRLYQDRDKNYSRTRGELYGTYTLPYLVLANTTVTDQAFKADPDYHGDTGEWIQGRPESAYALVAYKGLSLFAGRVGRNAGIAGEPGLMLSDSPYSFDHYGFDLNTRRFKFSFYTTRLNDMTAINVQGDSVYTTAKRYWVMQRGEIMLRDNLHVGLSQSATYGGPGRDFEAAYLNPLGLYYVMQRNTGAQLSGFWAADVWWKPTQQSTLYLHYLIDDIIVNNEPGQDDRAVHPDRFALLGKAIVSDAGIAGLQVGLSYARVWNWTYQSYRSWENPVYYNKNLGYPWNAVEQVRLELDYFGRPPWHLRLTGGYRRHGDQDLLAPFGDSKDPFPIGVVEHTGWGELQLDWLPSPWWWTRLGVRYEGIHNELNRSGAERNRLLLQVVLGVRGWVGI